MCAPKSAVETCPQRVFSPHPWLVWLFSESLIPGAPHLHRCCPSRSARFVFLLRGLVFLLRISYSRTFFHFHPHPCSFLCIRGASPTAQQTLTPAFMRGSCPPTAEYPPPTHPSAKFPQAFPPPCPLSWRLPQHSLVSQGTMCLCHRQQCPFISGAAPVYSGTRHKGRFVQLRDVSSWLCLIRAANPSHQPGPVSLGAGYATSQSGLWWPRGFAGPSPPPS